MLSENETQRNDSVQSPGTAETAENALKAMPEWKQKFLREYFGGFIVEPEQHCSPKAETERHA